MYRKFINSLEAQAREEKENLEKEVSGENTVMEDKAPDMSAENTLQGFAVLFLIVGIIVAIVGVVGSSLLSAEFRWTIFASTCGVVLWLLLMWALLRVLAEMSMTLKRIEKNKYEDKK